MGLGLAGRGSDPTYYSGMIWVIDPRWTTDNVSQMDKTVW
jgi:hypothetical protein